MSSGSVRIYGRLCIYDVPEDAFVSCYMARRQSSGRKGELTGFQKNDFHTGKCLSKYLVADLS